MVNKMKVGILAVQGDFLEHENALKKLGIPFVEIRQKRDLKGIDGIILVGGESTVQGKLLRQLDLFDDIKSRINEGIPVLATCAGLVLLAERLEDGEEPHLATLPVSVKRNAFGRQLGSFIKKGKVDDYEDFPMVFIRAPYITKVSNDVKVIAEVDSHIVGVKYKNQTALAFHPEMTDDLRLYEDVFLC